MHDSRLGGRSLAATAAISLIAALATSAPALAQAGSGGRSGEPIVRIGFDGGVSVPVSDAKELLNNGVSGSGFVLVNALGPGLPALRFAFSYDRFDYKSTAAGAGIGSTSTTNPGTSQILGATGGIKIQLAPGNVRPFVTAGVGMYDVHDALNLATGGQSTSSKMNFGVEGGAGVEVKLGRFSAFAEGRIQNVFTEGNTFSKTSSIQSMPVIFGVLF